MDLTSGELLYRANDMGALGRRLNPDISENFWQFLDSTQPNSIVNSEERFHSEKSISASIESYILKLRHRILTVRKSIEHIRHEVIQKIQYKSQQCIEDLLKMQQQFDHSALHLILQYYDILQYEISASRAKLIQENVEKNLLIKQAAVLRDIRLFACHLMVESRGKLGFTMLSTDSQQFARCVKAVLDNVQEEIIDVVNIQSFRSRIKVLNVFKLQNSFLSGKLQAASERVNNGKIKGLFCCLPQDQFYSFSVFGLHAQSVPYQATPNLSQLAGEVFSTAWFHAEPPAGVAVSLRQNTAVANALRVAGTAAKLAVQRVAPINSSSTPKPSKSAQHIYRFSRYSTISNLRGIGREALEGGVFLALCRVLVVQQHTVAGAIQDSDILTGLQQGCDCIYSSATEEYVLLQPKFVLPEFFMHVQFPIDSVISPSSVSAPETSLRPGRVPAMLVLDPLRTEAQSSRRDSEGAIKRTDAVFPLESLLLDNAAGTLERETAPPPRGSITHQQQQGLPAAADPTDVGGVNLQQTLQRKQGIVEALQRAVQTFHQEKDALLTKYARIMVT